MSEKDHRQLVEEAYEKDMLDKLAMLARGFDISGRRISDAEMMSAQMQYHDLKNKIDLRRIERERLKQERDLATNKLASQHEIEHRRLDIEEERVKVQKAEVIVKALEVAVNGGADPNQLLRAIQDLSQTLLPGPSVLAEPSRLMLEDKK